MAYEVDEVIFPIPQTIHKPGWARVCRSLFSADECRELLQFSEEHGRYYRSGGKKIKRDVRICYLHPDDAPWAFTKIAGTFARHNAWGFALSGIVEPMRIQKYGVSGYTRPHVDYDYTSTDQSKITAIVPLVPSRSWSGGDLTVADRRTARIDRGDCLLFPSFVWHAVSPVTRGERVVLSAWAAGPRLV